MDSGGPAAQQHMATLSANQAAAWIRFPIRREGETVVQAPVKTNESLAAWETKKQHTCQWW